MKDWSEMKAGKSNLSDEWHEQHSSSPRMPEKWEAMKPEEPSSGQAFVKQEKVESDNKIKRADVRTSESGQSGREA